MIIGYKNQIEILNSLLKKDLPSVGFLFWGPEKIGKKTIALDFIRGIFCENKIFGGCNNCKICLSKINSDFLFLEKESYGIDDLKEIIKFLNSTPLISNKKVVLIDNAHLLTIEAQNAFLKTLEELPKNSIVILVTSQPDLLLETIYSRLLKICFGLSTREEIEKLLKNNSIDEKLADKIIRYSFLRIGLASDFMTNQEILKEFEKKIRFVLSLEKINKANKIYLISKYQDILEDIWDIWQIVLRDEVIQKLEVANTYLLSKNRNIEINNNLLAFKTLNSQFEMKPLNSFSSKILALKTSFLL